MKILNFGSCNIDHVYSVEHIVTAGETISAKKMEIFPGGKGLNQSIAVARSGVIVYHAGCIGNNGDFLADILKQSGADTTYLKKEDIPNGHAIIQVDNTGENCIFIYSGSNGVVTETYIDKVLSDFGEGDFLMLQNEINNLHYIIKKAYEKKMQIVFNPAPFTDDLKKIDLKCISYLILNEVEAKGFYDAEDYKEFISHMTEAYPHIKLVLTLGKKGCVYADCNVSVYQPAFVVDMVDTTAAGDTFAGYFVSIMATSDDYSKAIKTASAASALAVSKMGAAPSIPFIEDVKNALQTLKPHTYEETETEKQKKMIVDYIDENLLTVDINEISEKLGYSKSYASIYIKNIMGVSFSKLLQKRRCKKAAGLLENTNLSIGEIINISGYENESFFRNKFKEFYGVSPFLYRKNIKKKEVSLNDK